MVEQTPPQSPSAELRVLFAKLSTVAAWIMPGRIAKLEELFRHLAQNYDRVVAERDALENRRDELMRALQDAERAGGVAKGAKRVFAAERPAFPADVLTSADARPITIIDVGAQNLSSEDHIYAPLQRSGIAKVIGFEPLAEAAEERRRGDPNVIMLNHFVGSGRPGTFHVGRFDPTSSLFEPNMPFLSQFVSLPQMCETVSSSPAVTIRLDDVPEISDCDFLKLDVQGGELDVLDGAPRLLAGVAVVHCEVEFAPVYKNQPLFADVDARLRAAGFELIDLMNSGYAGYADLVRPRAQSRLLWAEAVYFRSPESLAALGPAKLLRAGIIAHVNYGMYDLTARLLAQFDRVTGGATRERYLEELFRPSRNPP